MLRRSGPGPSPTSPAGRRKSGKFGLRMKKMAHIKPILCVFGMLFYSSGYTAPEMHHQQANVIQTTRAGAWPVWLIWEVPAALLRSRRAPKMLVGAGNELASKQLFRAPHTHTIFLSFTCSTYKARQACKSEAKIMQREHPNCTTFRICFSLYAVVGGAAISLRRRRLDGTWYPRRGLKRAKNGLLSADRS